MNLWLVKTTANFNWNTRVCLLGNHPPVKPENGCFLLFSVKCSASSLIKNVFPLAWFEPSPFIFANQKVSDYTMESFLFIFYFSCTLLFFFLKMVDDKKLSEIINTEHINVKYLPGKVFLRLKKFGKKFQNLEIARKHCCCSWSSWSYKDLFLIIVDIPNQFLRTYWSW